MDSNHNTGNGNGGSFGNNAPNPFNPSATTPTEPTNINSSSPLSGYNIPSFSTPSTSPSSPHPDTNSSNSSPWSMNNSSSSAHESSPTDPHSMFNSTPVIPSTPPVQGLGGISGGLPPTPEDHHTETGTPSSTGNYDWTLPAHNSGNQMPSFPESKPDHSENVSVDEGHSPFSAQQPNNPPSLSAQSPFSPINQSGATANTPSTPTLNWAPQPIPADNSSTPSLDSHLSTPTPISNPVISLTQDSNPSSVSGGFNLSSNSDTPPTDLSHLIGSYDTHQATSPITPIPPTPIPVPDAVAPQPVQIVSQLPTNPSPAQSMSSPLPTAGSSDHFPKWIIILGVLVLLGVIGASAYFILGIGKSDSSTSLPIDKTLTQPPTQLGNQPSPTVTPVVLTPTPATPSATLTIAPRQNSASAASALRSQKSP